MIHVPSPIEEPPAFEVECRQNGIAWLNNQQVVPKRPKDFWSPFRPDLRRGFGKRCGYYAMYVHDGTVDHFVPWDGCKAFEPRLAYEWTNFRFIDGGLNSRKKAAALLDPFDVQDDWFEVELPSLALNAVKVPAEFEAKAALTLEALELDQGLRVLELRWEWYEQHRAHGLTFELLQEYAPLVARAVGRWREEGRGEPPAIPRPVIDPFDNL